MLLSMLSNGFYMFRSTLELLEYSCSLLNSFRLLDCADSDCAQVRVVFECDSVGTRPLSISMETLYCASGRNCS